MHDQGYRLENQQRPAGRQATVSSQPRKQDGNWKSFWPCMIPK